MKRYYISDFGKNSVVNTAISIDIAERVSDVITSLLGEYELITDKSVPEDDLSDFSIAINEPVSGIVKIELVNRQDGISIKELLKRPVAEQCSAEEYYICDCRNCNKDCVHRDCFRRLPAAFGGKGLCARLK